MTVGKLDAQKTQAARQQMEFSNTAFWKPKAGNGEFVANYIRVLPPHESMEGKLFQPVSLHWMPDNTNFICVRRMFNQQCPVCNKGFEVMNAGGKSKEAKDNARKFWSNWTAYVNIVLLNKDGTVADENPKLWGASSDVTDLFLDMLQDEECGDFTDLETGRNLMVRCKKTEDGGYTKYDYSIRFSPNQTPFDYPEILEGLIDPTKVNQMLPVEQLESVAVALLHGPGASARAQQDPLALTQGAETSDEWPEAGSNGVQAAAPPASVIPQEPADEWGEEDPPASPPPTPAKASRSRKPKETAEDAEAQKERLRAELNS